MNSSFPDGAKSVFFSRKAVLERSGGFISTYLHRNSCFPVTILALFLIADLNKDLMPSQLAVVNGYDVRTNFDSKFYFLSNLDG